MASMTIHLLGDAYHDEFRLDEDDNVLVLRDLDVRVTDTVDSNGDVDDAPDTRAWEPYTGSSADKIRDVLITFDINGSPSDVRRKERVGA